MCPAAGGLCFRRFYFVSSNPGGSRFSRLLTRPDRHQGPNSLLYNKHRGFFSEAKRPERGVDRSPSSSVESKHEYMYTSTPLCATHGT
jgi:hypothetical protein